MNEAARMAVWQKGRDFCRNDQVKITGWEKTGEESERVQGKVSCSFGFIHHPMVEISRRGEESAVTDYVCDCYEFGDAGAFCSHCAALAYAACGEEKMPVSRSGPGGKSEAPVYFPIPMDSVRITAQEPGEDGTDLTVTAKVFGSFGFVHYPKIVITAEKQLKEYACDCYKYTSERKLCPHIQALQYKWKQQTNEEEMTPGTGTAEDEEAGAAESSGEELPGTGAAAGEESIRAAAAETEESPAAPWRTEPRSMQILLGRDPGTQEKRFWYPNDTERLLHANMGVIGTMGSGKTQFTKSMVAQLVRQQRNNFDGEELGILIFDYKGDYNETKPEFTEAVHARILKPFRLPFNPFSLTDIREKPQLPVHVANTFTDTITRLYKLGQKQFASLLRCVIQAYNENGIIPSVPRTWRKPAPTFDQVYKIYSENSDIRKNDSLSTAMEKLQQFEIFESDPAKTVSLFELLKGVVVVDISGYDPDIQNLIVAITLDLFYAQMKNQGSSRMNEKYRLLTKVLLVDEADNFMSAGFDSLKKILKEGREFGVATILSTQFLKHFCSREDDYSSYVLTWVVHRIDNLKKSEIEYIFKTGPDPDDTEQIFHRVKTLEKHESLVKAGNAPILTIRDLPFYEIEKDAEETYLKDAEEPDGPSAW